jgi:geranylgeranyl transferase type-1 subunit beta
MDPASLPATFFALLSLAIVGNVADIGEDARRKTLAWLRRMQRSDGSFGEVLGASGKVEGGRDMRYSYFATAVRWILREQENIEVDDIDVEALVGHIRGAQTFDGGLGESSEHESHGVFSSSTLGCVMNEWLIISSGLYILWNCGTGMS